MADAQKGNIHGIADKSDSPTDRLGYNDADLLTIDAMRTRLAAIDATVYTDERLQQMTANDMLYAIRINDNPETV